MVIRAPPADNLPLPDPPEAHRHPPGRSRPKGRFPPLVPRKTTSGLRIHPRHRLRRPLRPTGPRRTRLGYHHLSGNSQLQDPEENRGFQSHFQRRERLASQPEQTPSAAEEEQAVPGAEPEGEAGSGRDAQELPAGPGEAEAGRL